MIRCNKPQIKLELETELIQIDMIKGLLTNTKVSQGKNNNKI